MAEEEKKTFVVKDRRRFDADGNSRPEEQTGASKGQSSAKQAAPAAKPQPAPAAKPGPAAKAPPQAQSRPAPQAEAAEEDGEGSVSFADFVLSLATNAVIYLGGETPDGRVPGRVNLPAAAQHIDIIAMLARKTQGNLTPDEAELMESLLYDLRMKYLAVAQAQQPGRAR